MKATTISKMVAMALGGVALVAVSGQAHAGLVAINGPQSEAALSAAGIDPSQSLSVSFAAQTTK